MPDLVAFLAARLGEDEAVARAVPDGRFAYEMCDVREPVRTHGERHDPARVLAEVAAKRAIVAAYERAEVAFRMGQEYEDGMVTALDEAGEHLAYVYAEHPDYNPGWQPAGVEVEG